MSAGVEAGVQDLESDEDLADGSHFVEDIDGSVSKYLVANVNFFHRKKGFDVLTRRLQECQTNNVPLGTVRWLLKAVSRVMCSHYDLALCLWNFSQIRDLLPTSFLKQFITTVRVPLYDYVLKFTDEQLKNEDKKVLTDFSKQIEQILRGVAPTSVQSQLMLIIVGSC